MKVVLHSKTRDCTDHGFIHLYVVMVVLVMSGVISSLMNSTYTEHDNSLQAARSTLANAAADAARECIMYWQLEAVSPTARFNPNGIASTISCSVTDTYQAISVGNKFSSPDFCLGDKDKISYEYPSILVGPFPATNSCAKAKVIVTQAVLPDATACICLYRLEITGYDDCDNPTVERTFVTTF